MRRITNRAIALLALLAVFCAGVVILAVQFAHNGARWATNRANSHIYAGGALRQAGAVFDRNGVVLAESEEDTRNMPGGSDLRKATLHAVGDPQGYISTGAHAAYRGILTGYSRLNGIYDLIKYGKGSDVVLTIDAQLCKAAWLALEGRKGTVGVMNYKTGEVLCMVSSPTYDPLDKPENIDGNPAYDAVYLNRLLHGLFTPGSTFKIITAAGALAHIPAIESRTFNCTGKFSTGDGYVICNSVHGKLSFAKALEVSCNSAFAQIALELGQQNLRATANALGFNRAFQSEKLPLATSVFSAAARTPLELGWAGIGQHTTLANPAHMMMLLGAIANGGKATEPRLIKNTITPGGLQRPFSAAKTAFQMDAAIAARLQTLLRGNVTNNYDAAGRTAGWQLFGKTGTAQVDGKNPHAWFVGACLNPQMPYAIVVVGENAGSGRSVAFNIAVQVLRAAQ
ncbi:MAG: penicillin-binding protein [Oscillospiraceae bacterium]|jgi:peptidoglycan glycosyltransferase|nr:penicillin-binding protein [Oscillospiraceae bacterium]